MILLNEFVQLLPCPCCNSKAYFGQYHDDGGDLAITAHCEDCGIQTDPMYPSEKDGQSTEEIQKALAKVWNRRPGVKEE
jgi:hypothetical protein